MDYFKILYWICYNIASVLWVLFSSFFWLRGMWGLCSLTRDRTCIPCIGRQSLNHWITREVPSYLFSSLKFSPSPFHLTVCWEAHSVGFSTVWGLLMVPWGAVYRLMFPVLPANGSWSCHWIWSTFGETVSWLGLCVCPAGTRDVGDISSSCWLPSPSIHQVVQNGDILQLSFLHGWVHHFYKRRCSLIHSWVIPRV